MLKWRGGRGKSDFELTFGAGRLFAQSIFLTLLLLGPRHLRWALAAFYLHRYSLLGSLRKMAILFLTDMSALKSCFWCPFWKLCHVADRNFAPIGLHAAYAASGWLLVKRRCTAWAKTTIPDIFHRVRALLHLCSTPYHHHISQLILVYIFKDDVTVILLICFFLHWAGGEIEGWRMKV